MSHLLSNNSLTVEASRKLQIRAAEVAGIESKEVRELLRFLILP